MAYGSTQISRSRLSPGTRLNGIYEIDHPIASGGMGEVYKGHTIQTGDPVAIKVLQPEFAGNDAALALFRREASALHNLHHEAIVRYYVFTIEPVLRRPYLAMEFVEGQSLAEVVRREPLTYEAVRSLLKRVAAGLHVAHERGIVHRDVSSDNIMIPGGDVARAKIIDFGIARSTQFGDHTIIGGGFAGKYNYVSPEQLGLFGGDVRAKSDIYSLGLVLVEALTGQPVDMGGSQAAVLDKRRKVPDLGAIDLRIRPLLERMLQPDPEARPELDGAGRHLAARHRPAGRRAVRAPGQREPPQRAHPASAGAGPRKKICMGGNPRSVADRRRGSGVFLPVANFATRHRRSRSGKTVSGAGSAQARGAVRSASAHARASQSAGSAARAIRSAGSDACAIRATGAHTRAIQSVGSDARAIRSADSDARAFRSGRQAARRIRDGRPPAAGARPHRTDRALYRPVQRRRLLPHHAEQHRGKRRAHRRLRPGPGRIHDSR